MELFWTFSGAALFAVSVFLGIFLIAKIKCKHDWEEKMTFDYGARRKELGRTTGNDVTEDEQLSTIYCCNDVGM